MSGLASRRGFTLLEVSVVLVITFIAGLLVVPRWRAGANPLLTPDSMGNDEFADDVLHALRLARRQAVFGRQVVTVRIDVAAGMVRMDTAGSNGTGTFREESVSRIGFSSTGSPAEPVMLIFQPTGAVLGDRRGLRPNGAAGFDIDAWSGEVTRVAP